MAAETVAAQDATLAPEQPDRDVRLVFEREVFLYPTVNEPDPFSPLVGPGSGPLFEELELRGIIYSDDPPASVALLVGPDDRIYRLRADDRVSNVRVAAIGPRCVRFVVDRFGVVRYEHRTLSRPELDVPQ